MKLLACFLTAAVSVALSIAVYAEEDDGVVTGKVISVTKDGEFKIDASSFEFTPACDDCATPKVGETVRVHYYHCGSGRKGFHHCVKKLEKVAGDDGGAKKR